MSNVFYKNFYPSDVESWEEIKKDHSWKEIPRFQIDQGIGIIQFYSPYHKTTFAGQLLSEMVENLGLTGRFYPNEIPPLKFWHRQAPK